MLAVTHGIGETCGVEAVSFPVEYEGVGMVKREGKVKNAYGIHCRPSAEVAKAVKQFKGRLEVCNSEGKKADPRSVLALLSLTLTCGDSFSVVVDGPGEAEICDTLMSFLEKEYDFQR